MVASVAARASAAEADAAVLAARAAFDDGRRRRLADRPRRCWPGPGCLLARATSCWASASRWAAARPRNRPPPWSPSPASPRSARRSRSENVRTCLAFARRAEAGTVWTNTWMDGLPEVARGGMKRSGPGREIGRREVRRVPRGENGRGAPRTQARTLGERPLISSGHCRKDA
nr:aldehyde dehydrogenase family protein [Halovulum marinum]